ncbi:MAG: 6-carboxytetrahydropterin synthase [Rickettsiaceae bacterium]|nr:6-carboxytetrahydropterin synthase [Rickettsiaceae bacterium]MDP4832258.1 6-carboxytetrahydropterin synthase [Rickettsiaceae bacterium]MDP5021023.1 6-carboxytetrahydropterin synthase [Rickettsiaceae bacterium]MDP5083572.1 6-carboxytetrahydropterin synthase [Rickettsiaceae bacterium]
MIECTRRIEFDAGHRVIGHQHKCKYLHGHRYVLEITAMSTELNELGMVVDFGELKNIIKDWIDENLDHNVILHEDDKALGSLIASQTGQNIYYLKSNPTAENIALHLKSDIIPKLFTKNSFNIVRLKLFETPNSFVEVK